MSLAATVWTDHGTCQKRLVLKAIGKGLVVIHLDYWEVSSPQVFCEVAPSLYGELYGWVNPKVGSEAHMTAEQAEQTINYLKEAT